MAKATKASTKKRSSRKASSKRTGASTRRAPAKATKKPAAKKAVKKPAKKTGRKPAAKKVVKKAATKPAKKTAGKPAPKKTAKKTAKKAVRKPAKKTAATRATARKPAKKSVRKVARKTAKKAVQRAAKAPARKPARKPAQRASGTTGGTKAAWNSVGADTAAPAPLPVAPEQKTAPKKFQRQYKTWLQRLIGLRRRLLGETTQLEEEALKAGEGDVSIDHMADYGSDSYEQEFTLSLIESKSEALRDVDEAIRKIEVRTYGLCEECETLIPKGRLEVLPHTRLCIACKSAQESASGF